MNHQISMLFQVRRTGIGEIRKSQRKMKSSHTQKFVQTILKRTLVSTLLCFFCCESALYIKENYVLVLYIDTFVIIQNKACTFDWYLWSTDDNVTISCKVKGDPKFKTEWYKYRSMPLPENAKQNDDGDLTITKVSFKNSGTYQCISSDDLKSYESRIFLLVHSKFYCRNKCFGWEIIYVAWICFQLYKSLWLGNLRAD